MMRNDHRLPTPRFERIPQDLQPGLNLRQGHKVIRLVEAEHRSILSQATDGCIENRQNPLPLRQFPEAELRRLFLVAERHAQELCVPCSPKDQIAKTRKRISQPTFELSPGLGTLAVEIAVERRKISSIPSQENLILFRRHLDSKWIGLHDPKPCHNLIEPCKPSHLLGSRCVEIRQERLVGAEWEHRPC